ncbi:MAG: alanyl-tRNA editing protein [Clostridia bacterium]|nr:alanyl-tRNA editing protein [Clostridia bacterium]
MTKKLYENDGHLSEFAAKVLSCEKKGDLFDVVLDQTAFFPEGGGQPADTGLIGEAMVSDVQIRDGIVHHTVDSAIAENAVVECAVDMEVRFPRMQCHTGEHIVSGIIHSLYGYNNVGFHMGSKDITLDIDGEMSEEQIRQVELIANKAVAENIPVTVTYPTPAVADSLDYRSKLEITEGLRLVQIGEYDLCACCAPHVARTGEIGIIKILEYIRYKGGMRLHMLCGLRALEDYTAKFTELSRVSELLSAPKDECAEAVRHLQKQIADAEYKTRETVKAVLLAEADRAEATEGNMVFIEPRELASGLRDMVTAALPKCGGICAAFAGEDGNYTFVMASSSVDLRAASAEIRQALNAKGGGSPDMIQGNASTTAEVIRKYFYK